MECTGQRVRRREREAPPQWRGRSTYRTSGPGGRSLVASVALLTAALALALAAASVRAIVLAAILDVPVVAGGLGRVRHVAERGLAVPVGTAGPIVVVLLGPVHGLVDLGGADVVGSLFDVAPVLVRILHRLPDAEEGLLGKATEAPHHTFVVGTAFRLVVAIAATPAGLACGALVEDDVAVAVLFAVRLGARHFRAPPGVPARELIELRVQVVLDVPRRQESGGGLAGLLLGLVRPKTIAVARDPRLGLVVLVVARHVLGGLLHVLDAKEVGPGRAGEVLAPAVHLPLPVREAFGGLVAVATRDELGPHGADELAVFPALGLGGELQMVLVLRDELRHERTDRHLLLLAVGGLGFLSDLTGRVEEDPDLLAGELVQLVVDALQRSTDAVRWLAVGEERPIRDLPGVVAAPDGIGRSAGVVLAVLARDGRIDDLAVARESLGHCLGPRHGHQTLLLLGADALHRIERLTDAIGFGLGLGSLLGGLGHDLRLLVGLGLDGRGLLVAQELVDHLLAEIILLEQIFRLDRGRPEAFEELRRVRLQILIGRVAELAGSTDMKPLTMSHVRVLALIHRNTSFCFFLLIFKQLPKPFIHFHIM